MAQAAKETERRQTARVAGQQGSELGGQEVARQDEGRKQPARRGMMGGSAALGPAMLPSPFAVMRRFFDDLDWFFESGTPSPITGGAAVAPRATPAASALTVFPAIDIVERDNQLVIRADLPGMNADDVVIEVQDEQLVISGERVDERRENEGGVYRSERSYGRFVRAVALPEGADPTQAVATFNNGVLEIAIPASRADSRRIQIQGSEAQREGSEAQRGGGDARVQAAAAGAGAQQAGR